MAGFATRIELIKTSDCVCPGQNVTYECTIVDGWFTVWRWSRTDINDCEIILYHLHYGDYQLQPACGMVAQGMIMIGVNATGYTSQLSIMIPSSNNVDQGIIQCSIDNRITEILIGRAKVLLTTGMQPGNCYCCNLLCIILCLAHINYHAQCHGISKIITHRTIPPTNQCSPD